MENLEAGLDPIVLLQFAAPVALAAIGETVCEKGGVINIGLEGGMLCGAFFGMLASYLTGSAWIGLSAAVLAGLCVSLIFAIFTINLSADQVVVGTAINLLAMGLTGTLFRSEFGQSGQLLAVNTLPRWHQLDPLLLLMFLSLPATWFLLMRTRWGLAVRSTGEYPQATEAAGFSVQKLRLQAALIGGLYAGLAGAYLSLVVTGSFAENMTAGRGFMAIAMVTFGRWQPWLVFIASLLIGFAGSLQYWFQGMGWKVPFQLFIAMPYLIALFVLLIAGKGTVAPRALATAYRREQ